MARVEENEIEMTDDEYEEFLNDIFKPISICGIIFSAVRILREMGPIAFHCGKSDEESDRGYTYTCGICGTEYENDEDSAADCCKEEGLVLDALDAHNAGEFEGLVVSDTSDVPKGYVGEVLHINDHGNATLYLVDEDGDSEELGAIV